MKLFTTAMIMLLIGGFCNNRVQAATYGINLGCGKKIGYIKGTNHLEITNNASSAVKVSVCLWYLENYKKEILNKVEIAAGKKSSMSIPKDHDVQEIVITYPNGSSRSHKFAIATNGYDYRGNTAKGTKKYQHSKNRVETNGTMTITDDSATVSTHSGGMVEF